MKMSIKQDVLINALDRGAMAALSEEAQADMSVISLILKSVTIKTDGKDLVIESATKNLSSKYSIPVSKENGIEIKENGEIIVPAKELYDWAKRQQNSVLAIVLSKLDTPEIVNPLTSEASSTKGIKKLGTVKIMSKDDTKTGTKWSLDCYVPEQLGPSKIELPKNKKFSISSAQLKEGFAAIDFSAMPNHYEHVYDAISFQSYKKDTEKENSLYMVTFDTRRIATFKTIAKDNNLDINIMIPHKILGTISKLADDSDISFYHDAATNKIFLQQENNGIQLLFKIATTDIEKAKKFVPIALIEGYKYKKIANVSRTGLINRLSTSSMVNNEHNLISMETDKMTIYSASAIGKSPVTCVLPIKDLSKDYKVVSSPIHITDIMKALKDDYVDIMVKEVEDMNKSFKFTSKDENIAYFLINTDVSKSKYNQVSSEE